jgi:hypothetical protein
MYSNSHSTGSDSSQTSGSQRSSSSNAISPAEASTAALPAAASEPLPIVIISYILLWNTVQYLHLKKLKFLKNLSVWRSRV